MVGVPQNSRKACLNVETAEAGTGMNKSGLATDREFAEL